MGPETRRVVNLITYGQDVIINLSKSPRLQSSVQSPCILSTIHDSKNVFTTKDIYINKSKILHQ